MPWCGTIPLHTLKNKLQVASKYMGLATACLHWDFSGSVTAKAESQSLFPSHWRRALRTVSLRSLYSRGKLENRYLPPKPHTNLGQVLNFKVTHRATSYVPNELLFLIRVTVNEHFCDIKFENSESLK